MGEGKKITWAETVFPPINLWSVPRMSRYTVTIRGEDLDVYDILEAYDVNHPIGHAVKKLLMAGKRGAKDEIQDLNEAKASIDRAIEMATDV